MEAAEFVFIFIIFHIVHIFNIKSSQIFSVNSFIFCRLKISFLKLNFTQVLFFAAVHFFWPFLSKPV